MLAWNTAHLPGSDMKFRDLLARDPSTQPRGWEDEFKAFETWAKAMN